MIKVGQIVSDITANMNPFRKDMTRIQKEGEKAAKSVTSSFRQMGQKMRRTGSMLTAAISAPLVGVGGMAVKTAADYEKLRISMDALNGSAEEGARNFERLKEFSAGTPFQLQDLAQAQNMLQGFSLSADDAFNSMKMIGDIAAITGGDIQGIGIAFGQAAAEGRVMTRDIRQFINQGVPMVQMLADTMGVATDEIFDLASQGKITFDVLQQAFQDATSEGGRFANGMKEQANTIWGVWSTMKDNVSIAMSELGDSIVETLDLKQLAKDITANIRTITKRFAGLSDDTKKEILQIAGLFVAGGPILMALGQAAIAISAFSKLVRTRFALITGAAALVSGTIVQQGQLWSKVFGDSEKEVDNFTTSAMKGMKSIIGPFLEFTEKSLGAGAALENFQSLLSNLGGESLEKANKALTDTNELISFINGDVNALTAGLEASARSAADIGNNAGDGFSALTDTEALQTANATAVSFTNTLGLMNPKLNVMANGLEMAKGAASSVSEAMKVTRDEVSKAAQAGGQFGQMMGNALSQAVLHANSLLDTLKNLAKQLASKVLTQGLTMLLSGGTMGGGGLIGSILGGIFHNGGIVGGSGDVPIMAKAGEGVFTEGQMKAMGGLMRGGGSGMNEAKISRAFERALGNHLQKLGPEEIYAMNRKGQFSF